MVTEQQAAAQWLASPEKGSDVGIKTLLVLTRLFGRQVARWPLQLVAAYYASIDAEVRGASRRYLQHLYPSVTAAMVHRHIRTFAECTLDRLFFLREDFDLFEVTCNGIEHLVELRERGKGAILLGAHLGSFEAARTVGGDQDFPIHILVHFANAKRINDFLRQIDPAFISRVIEIDPADTSHIFRVQEVIEQGGMVAILGDRVGLNERHMRAEFLGEPAAFPTGPYALAAALGCPVYLTFGLYHRPNRYNLYCEPFADEVVLPRGSREEALARLVQRFAMRLEHYCRLAPYNWFNFYDYWKAM